MFEPPLKSFFPGVHSKMKVTATKIRTFETQMFEKVVRILVSSEAEKTWDPFQASLPSCGTDHQGSERFSRRSFKKGLEIHRKSCSKRL